MNFYVCNYIAIFVKTLKLLVSNIQNLQNAKFYSCQIKFVYCMEFKLVLSLLASSAEILAEIV